MWTNNHTNCHAIYSQDVPMYRLSYTRLWLKELRIELALQMQGHSQIFFKRSNLAFYDLKLLINKGEKVFLLSCFCLFL